MHKCRIIQSSGLHVEEPVHSTGVSHPFCYPGQIKTDSSTLLMLAVAASILLRTFPTIMRLPAVNGHPQIFGALLAA